MNTGLRILLNNWVVFFLILIFALEKWVIKPYVNTIYLNEDKSTFVARLRRIASRFVCFGQHFRLSAVSFNSARLH